MTLWKRNNISVIIKQVAKSNSETTTAAIFKNALYYIIRKRTDTIFNIVNEKKPYMESIIHLVYLRKEQVDKNVWKLSQ